MFGNAGALLVLIQLYKHTNNAIYLKMAESAGEKLIIAQEKKENQLGGWIGSASKNALSGFSHGAAGIVYALSKLWENTKNSNAYQSILLGLELSEIYMMILIKIGLTEEIRQKTKLKNMVAL